MKVSLSASRIKTAHNCSWLYWTRYGPMKLPDKTNSGALLGGLVHIILECLAAPRRRRLAEELIKSKNFIGREKCPVEKLLIKLLKKVNLLTPELLIKAESFIINGLSHDFFGEVKEGLIEAYTEKDFSIEEVGRYKIRGFIDRLFIYEDGHALIRDYKTSKESYKSDEGDIQGIMYCLAVKKLFPHIKTVSVEFLFLKFDCNLESSWETGFYQGKQTKKTYHNGGGKISVTYSHEEILGFEYELEEEQNYLERFTEKSAKQNFAADQNHPENGSFGGKMLCGFCSYEGELKKDSSPKFSCPSRWPMKYWHVLDKDNNWVASCFIDEREKFLTKYPIESYNWVEKFYGGCLRHNK